MSAGPWFCWRAGRRPFVHLARPEEFTTACGATVRGWWRRLAQGESAAVCQRCDRARKKLEAKS